MSTKSSTKSSLRSILIVAAAAAGLGVSPAFALGGFDNDTGNLQPSYYTGNGARHTGRPPHEHAVTPMQQNDWWWGGSNH